MFRHTMHHMILSKILELSGKFIDLKENSNRLYACHEFHYIWKNPEGVDFD